MMRRRALQAASQTGGGGDAPEFPLYLYFDYCEEFWPFKTCVRAADDVGKLYFSFLWKMISLHGIFNGYSYVLNENTLDVLGIHIFIDGNRIIEISSPLPSDYQYMDFATPASSMGIWSSNGEISQDTEI